jgi:indolepyruvate ferredoxin oxidoreductase
VPQIAQQMRAEGVQTIVIVSDDIGKWSKRELFPEGVEFFDRKQLDDVQKQLRQMAFFSILSTKRLRF